MENRKNYRLLYGRLSIVVILIVIQLIILIYALLRFNQSFQFFWGFCFILSIVEVLVIINKNLNPAYKLALVIPILAFPVFGGLFYILLVRRKLKKSQREQLNNSKEMMETLLTQDNAVSCKIAELDEAVALQLRYIRDFSHFPVYENTTAEYLSPGEKLFESLKEQLRSAEKFIFMEYFIIQEGIMWNEILDIMVDKVRSGVDVRVIYDDIGCVQLLPYKYDKHLETLGIKCSVFNPFKPIISMWHNNRDHRKITVVDGRVAFTGGINMADEYINKCENTGYWKDASVMIEGEAVWSFTLMFLSLWNVISPETLDFEKYRGTADFPRTDGFVAPYSDIPIDDEKVGENVYLNLITKAKKYIRICTPYFIVDNEIMTALCLAAKSGVVVQIVTPYTADKWYAHMITRANYQQLIENGVEVYEYTPGFIHSKTVVSDYNLGIVGTINFDFRSMYLHFECAVLMYNSSAIKQIDDDFDEILKVSQQISLEQCLKEKFIIKIIRMVLKLFAPLM